MNLLSINSIDDCERRIKELNIYRNSQIKAFYTAQVLEEFVQELLEVSVRECIYTVYGAMIVGESDFNIDEGDRVFAFTEGYERCFIFNSSNLIIDDRDILEYLEEEFGLDSVDGMGELPSPYGNKFSPDLYVADAYSQNGYYVCDYYYDDVYTNAMKDLYKIIKRREKEFKEKIYDWCKKERKKYE